MRHQHNVRCIDGWHADLIYSTADDPQPGHFDIEFPGCVTEHEQAMEAPLHPILAAGRHGPPDHWHTYVVRWRPR